MSEFILPESNVLVDPISESECSNLGNNTGLDLNDGETTCEALQSRLLPLLSQIIGDISSGTMTIYPNDDSKCKEGDKSPTLASMLSRIYRVSQAFACILCQYDPSLSNLLMNGTYPQILMGKPNENAYPMWVNPDNTPTADSHRPVTSDGVFKAIQNAIMSVWHLWDKGANGTFMYYDTDYFNLPDTGNENGDYALVYDNVNEVNTIYVWQDDEWVEDEVISFEDMTDFAVIHIEKGDLADKGLYWFESGWNILDADLADVEQRIAALEAKAAHAVEQLDDLTVYKLGVANNYAAASAVPSESGVTKIVFVRGA